MNDIMKNQNYLNPSRYISGRIIEYDIKSANISVLRQNNEISEEYYQYLYNLPKKQREIEIGLNIKQDQSIYKKIQSGIISAKIDLQNSNNITDDSIVRIANDAVYINSPLDLAYTQFGDYVKFLKKSEFNVYLNLNKLVLFLGFREDGNINVDVKGISEKLIPMHENFMINSIVTTVVFIERYSIQEAMNYISNLCADYINYNLPIGYYREFNTESSYRVKDFTNSFQFGLSDISEYNKRSLDINYNYTVLRELWSIVLELYTTRVF